MKKQTFTGPSFPLYWLPSSPSHPEDVTFLLLILHFPLERYWNFWCSILWMFSVFILLGFISMPFSRALTPFYSQSPCVHSQLSSLISQSSLRLPHPLSKPQRSSGFCPQLYPRATQQWPCSQITCKTWAKAAVHSRHEPAESERLGGRAQARAFFNKSTDGSEVQPAWTTSLSVILTHTSTGILASTSASSGSLPWTQACFLDVSTQGLQTQGVHDCLPAFSPFSSHLDLLHHLTFLSVDDIGLPQILRARNGVIAFEFCLSLIPCVHSIVKSYRFHL